MKNLNLLTAILFALVFVACDKKGSGPEPDRSPNRPSVPATPIEEPAVDAPRLDREAVEEVVSAWLAAQNEGDFTVYMNQYASEMIGIKRVGDERSEYDRGGWKADRNRMFDEKMEVAISNVSVRVGQHVGVVDFEQTFESGGFEDVGAKRLVIESTDAGPKIIREEMLGSTIVRSQAEDNTDVLSVAMPVIADKYVVISAEVDDSWEKGRARRADGILAFKAVYLNRIPDAARQFKDKSLTLQTPQGTTCERKVSQVRAVARADLPDGEIALIMQERPKEGPDELYEMAGREGLVLAAEIDSPCVGAVFATDSGTHHTYGTFEEVDEISESVLLAFRSDGAWQNIQKEFEATGQKGFWDQGPTAWSVEVRGAQYVAVQAEAGPGCGEFRGELFALYRTEGDEVEPLTVGESSRGIFRPVMAVVFSGSDEPVFFSREKIAAKTDKNWSILQDLTPPSYICPC